jgi:hypothetical protein
VTGGVDADGEPGEKIRLVYSAYGVVFALETMADLLPYLPSPLVPGGEELPESDASVPAFRFFRAHTETGELIFSVAGGDAADTETAPDVIAAAQLLESRIHRYVAAESEQVVFVHAGVVAWRGKALIVPGSSHSGKSTLIAALTALGATYYSDEYAVFDFDGRVHAFPRQLRLRPDISHRIASHPSRTPGIALVSLPVGWVFGLRYSPDAAWKPKRLTAGQMLLTLLGNTVAVRRQSELTVSFLKRALGSATGLQSERGEAALAAEQIVRMIEELG